MASPPSVPLPKPVQTMRFLVRPISFMQHWRHELGETFAASLIGPGEVVFVSDAESVKALYSRDRQNTIAPGRNIVLRPLLGRGVAAPPGGRRAPAPPQADAPALPWRAHARLRGRDRRGDPATRSPAGAQGEEFRPPPDHAGDHARGDPARGLRRRGREAPRRALRVPHRDPGGVRLAARDRPACLPPCATRRRTSASRA